MSGLTGENGILPILLNLTISFSWLWLLERILTASAWLTCSTLNSLTLISWSPGWQHNIFHIKVVQKMHWKLFLHLFCSQHQRVQIRNWLKIRLGWSWNVLSKLKVECWDCYLCSQFFHILTLSPSFQATELWRTPETKIPRPNSAPPRIIRPRWSPGDMRTQDWVWKEYITISSYTHWSSNIINHSKCLSEAKVSPFEKEEWSLWLRDWHADHQEISRCKMNAESRLVIGWICCRRLLIGWIWSQDC